MSRSGRTTAAAAGACALALLAAAGAAGDHPNKSSDPYAAIRGSFPPIPATIAKTDVPPIPNAAAKDPWPPIPDGGALFVHYGEEHWNDADGLRILPQVVADTAAYRPDLVTMSGDKANDGTADQLLGWKELMKVYDEEGIPWFPSPGNHDRKAHPGFPAGVDPLGELTNYFGVFADRPYPFGDASPIDDPQFSPGTRPASDPPGASTHYALEYGPARWVFLDNGCFSFFNCDALQNPGFPDAEGNQTQMDFLAREAGKANAAGDLLFVVMHMPTQDDRPGHSQPTPFEHTMGEGTSPENASFETTAAALGVDGVFAAHVKGQWEYTAQGVPFYTDGGAGGEVYVGPGEETGVDSGYWHGFRLVHVRRGEVTTDVVPVFAAAGITVSGPGTLAQRESGQFEASAVQPTEQGPRVTNLELREPDRSASNGDTLPTPARIWTTGNPLVLTPEAAPDDDPRRDPGTQTISGRFSALCPGEAQVTITSGWESQSTGVTVPSAPGPIVDRIRRRARALEPGHRRKVASVDLAQPAQVIVRVIRRGRTVKTLAETCHRDDGPLKASWNGRRNGKKAKPGRYRVQVIVRSDQPTVKRSFTLRVRD
jgi:hypothetical protein